MKKDCTQRVADIVERKQPFTLMIAIVALLFGMPACNDSVDQVNEPGPPTLAISEFPHTLGTRWTYTVYDSLTGQTDTASVSITGNTELTNTIPVQIWVTVRGLLRDTSYVAIRGNMVEFYDDQSSNNPEVFIFPLAVGNSWGTSIDTTTVIGIDVIETSTGTFNKSFHVSRRVFGLNYGLLTDTWLASNAGVVMRIKVESDFSSSTREAWSLVTKAEE